MHCHHEKVVIVDGQIAFVGGIDNGYAPAALTARR
jgi:phosphatidylserine/phosphatidylglycerophosphate/cardiolipin synthase-like enzyme